MSITATLTGLFIMLVRRIKKIPRRITVFLWIAPFLRMLFPLGLNSSYSLMTLLSKINTKTVIVYQLNEDVAVSMMNSVGVADTYFPITYKERVLENIFGVASVIWIIVAFAILLMLAFAYVASVYEIKDSTYSRDNIYFSEKIISPAVYGIVKPKIILPASYKDGNIELIILHEKTHIRSQDNLWRIIAFIIVSVHWFNPFCWLFLKVFFTDIELACDERVLTKLGANRVKEYALLLLESRQGATILASAFGGAKMRARIENILSFKKLTWLSITVFVPLIGVVFYVLLTNAG